MCTRLAAILLFSLLSSGFLHAKPNFTGEWKMNAAKSDFGPMPAPQTFHRNVQHDDPKMSIKTEQKGERGEIKSDLSYTTDGKPFTNKGSFGEVTGTAKWDGDVLVVETKRTVQDIEIKQTDRWTLDDGGKSMKISTVINTPHGDFQVTVSFEK